MRGNLYLCFMLALAWSPLGAGAHAQIVADGGLEAGTPNPFWDEFSKQFGTPICNVERCGDFFGGPFEGDWWAWFGGSAQLEIGWLFQEVTIPRGRATLRFWLDINLSSGNGTDSLTVSVDGIEVFTALESDAEAFHPWAQVAVDVTDFADGGRHVLRFDGITRAFTNFYVDAVEITVEAICPADLDGNGEVGFSDLLLVLSSWGPCEKCPEDLDGSGDVGFSDLLIVLAAWGPCAQAWMPFREAVGASETVGDGAGCIAGAPEDPVPRGASGLFERHSLAGTRADHMDHPFTARWC